MAAAATSAAAAAAAKAVIWRGCVPAEALAIAPAAASGLLQRGASCTLPADCPPSCKVHASATSVGACCWRPGSALTNTYCCLCYPLLTLPAAPCLSLCRCYFTSGGCDSIGGTDRGQGVDSAIRGAARHAEQGDGRRAAAVAVLLLQGRSQQAAARCCCLGPSGAGHIPSKLPADTDDAQVFLAVLLLHCCWQWLQPLLAPATPTARVPG